MTAPELVARQRAVLQSIVDGCVHPATARCRVMVNLAPIREVLAIRIDEGQPPEDQPIAENPHFMY
jgi:hypothetical protein